MQGIIDLLVDERVGYFGMALVGARWRSPYDKYRLKSYDS